MRLALPGTSAILEMQSFHQSTAPSPTRLFTIYHSLFTIYRLSSTIRSLVRYPLKAANGRKLPQGFGILNSEAGSIMTEQNSAPATGNSRPDNSDEKTRALVAEYEARLDEVAELIARVRHEINNPLAGVLGQAQLLLREDLSDRVRKRAQTIEELALRLRDIVAQLRHIQKPLKTAEGDEAHSG